MINDNQTKLSKLGFASDWIHAAERSKKTPTISEVLRRRSPFRSLQPSPLRRMLTQRCRTIAVHRRWCWSMRAPTTFVGDGRMNFLVTSFWLERTSCRFRVRLRRSQYFSNTNHVSHWYLSQLFTEGLLQEPPSSVNSTPRCFITRLLMNLMVKEFWISITIWPSYGQFSTGSFFYKTRCIYPKPICFCIFYPQPGSKPVFNRPASLWFIYLVLLVLLVIIVNDQY